MTLKLVSSLANKDPEYIPAEAFLDYTKAAGVPYENLARFLQYTYAVTELNINFVKRVKYDTEPPVNILYAGVYGLPIVRGLGITRAMASDPYQAPTCAFRMSQAGTGFGYLPNLDMDKVNSLHGWAQGMYAIWIARRAVLRGI